MQPSLLRERALAVLERRGSTFGDLTLTQFDDPLLAEHAVYLSVVDIPKHVSVSSAIENEGLMCVYVCMTYTTNCVSVVQWYSLFP